MVSWPPTCDAWCDVVVCVWLELCRLIAAMCVLVAVSACVVEGCGTQEPVVELHLFPSESTHVVIAPVVLQVTLYWLLLPVWDCEVGE